MARPSLSTASSPATSIHSNIALRHPFSPSNSPLLLGGKGGGAFAGVRLVGLNSVVERSDRVAGDHTRIWASVYVSMWARLPARVDGPSAPMGERKHGDTEHYGYNDFPAVTPRRFLRRL